MTDAANTDSGILAAADGGRVSVAHREEDRISEVVPVQLCGHIEASMDLSGAVVVNDFLVLGADEGHRVQVLKWRGEEACWGPVHSFPLAKLDQETDIEALTYGDGYLYVIGSHSHRRRRLKPELSVRRNRERLLQIQKQPSRSRLFRLAFDSKSGAIGDADSVDLNKRIRKDPLLKPFFGLPGKENGIDIEGMGFAGGKLYIGFRGPVLRDNYVPVMVLDYARTKAYNLLFVRLDGQGIRDLVALDDGFLILSGPVNDAPGPFHLWWWDGRDQVPGKDATIEPALLLGAVTTRGGAKAEGLALLGEDDGTADILVVYETSTATQAVSMRVDLRR
ncbi:MAG: DUF3616 domain-containing protein [Gammaproteobacteria bacterium]|nr:DUF3616 domain-containing protein [Gammaproteobacteria bacterium]